ncbi:MAG: hypothetical protein Q8N33_15135 [Rhodocyclaceae bacterium]|nr:hypothetical protein [Rhodocyclaceae bacterium]
MPVFRLGDKLPQLAPSVWIAPNATVIGDVYLAENVSVWWNAVLRGDNDPITIGRDITVGHKVMLHGCTIGDGSMIGMGSIVRELSDAQLAMPAASAVHYVENAQRYRQALFEID